MNLKSILLISSKRKGYEPARSKDLVLSRRKGIERFHKEIVSPEVSGYSQS